MDLNGIPLFALLQNKLGYLNQRQGLIAQNVANASTPGYTPSDLKAFSDQPGMQMDPVAQPMAATALASTDPAHLAGAASQADPAKARAYEVVAAPDSETTLDGNQVVLEEQMIKMSDTGGDYDTAIGLYQKAVAMLHTAVQKPGGV
jgi:flagellar basal-body rod protein FlgB